MNPKYRAFLILAVLVIAVIQVVPTFGWMALSDEQRQARLEKWAEEDQAFEQPGYFGELWGGIRRWAEFDRNRVINLGLDLQGGVHMVVGIDIDAIPEEELNLRYPEGWTRADMLADMQESVLERIRRRVDEFEAKEPLIQKLGDSQIQIQLPGEKDEQRAKDLIMRTAFLEFKLVVGGTESLSILRAVNDHFDGDFMRRLTRPKDLSSETELYVPAEQFERLTEMIEEAEQVEDLIPENRQILLGRLPRPGDNAPGASIHVVERTPLMTGEGLTRSMARPDSEMGGGRWEIQFEFDAASANRFGEVTEANVGRSMAIVVDGKVESAPSINGPIYGSGRITGSFTREQAQDLAIGLNSGSLPVPITEEQTGVVGATLGADSINKGVTSAAAGLAVVVIFMLVYYRMAGFVANIALLVNAVLVVAALAYFGATLTLPGIAGLILTIGMAVDANVLIFERIREEIRNGRGIHASIDSGFARATSAILDSNITTLIAAAILFEFGTGPIQGFAVTLSIGVCTSVFSALVVSRAIFDFLTQRKVITKLTMMSIVRPDTKLNFLGTRRPAIAFSIVAIIAGVALFGARGSDSFGVDFTTGTNMIVSVENQGSVNVGDVRNNLVANGFHSSVVTEYGDAESNTFLIRLGETPEQADTQEGETVSDAALRSLAALAGGEANLSVEKVDTIGPAVGAKLKRDALLSVTYSLFFIILYLWFRFELKFAVAAVAAVFHDVLFTVGAFALMGTLFGGYQISLDVVAAVLTIIGYSLNDTIVIFDRVREDLKLHRGRDLSYIEILNISMNNTLSRTILTSLTTLFVVLILFIFGGVVIRDFAFALIVGIITGTYSTVCIASPIVYYWDRWQNRRRAAKATDEAAARGRRTGTKSTKNKKGTESESTA